jgi:16S rRNA (cytosine967-C5)-methyltransferase
MSSPAKQRSIFGGRDVALAALLDAWAGKAFAADVVAARRRSGVVDGREGAFALQLALICLRHSFTIDHVLGAVASYDRRRVTDWVRGVLHIAAAQMLYLDRVPVFAAVDQAVEQARAVAGGPAGRMVNAILRRLSEAIVERRAAWTADDPTRLRIGWDTAVHFRRDVLPPLDAPKFDHIVVATSFPRAVFRGAAERYGAAAVVSAAWASQAEPALVFHPHTLRLTPEEFLERVQAWSAAQADVVNNAAYVRPGAAMPPWITEGLAYIQDTTAYAAARHVEAQPGEKILDLCAAPGGKSVTMALAARDQATIVAADVSSTRLDRLRETIERLELTGIRPLVLDASKPIPDDMLGDFDAVLLDTPCSNTGVLSRRPEARYRLDDHHFNEVIRLQEKLLLHAAQCVRPGGRLVYSTCSIMPRENEEAVRRFLADRDTWELEDERVTLPAWGPQVSDWRDGGYIARLRHR